MLANVSPAYLQVLQPSSRHIEQLLSLHKVGLREPGKRQMASREVLTYCPSAVILSSCYKEIIKNENKDSGNTITGYLALWQLS